MVNEGTYFAYRYICDSRKCASLGSFLGVFALLRKASISFVMAISLSVRLSVRMDQGETQFNDICEI